MFVEIEYLDLNTISLSSKAAIRQAWNFIPNLSLMHAFTNLVSHTKDHLMPWRPTYMTFLANDI